MSRDPVSITCVVNPSQAVVIKLMRKGSEGDLEVEKVTEQPSGVGSSYSYSIPVGLEPNFSYYFLAHSYDMKLKV